MSQLQMTEREFADHVRRDYLSKGFREIDTGKIAESLGGQYQPDLAFRRGDQVHVIELKAARARRRVEEIRRYRALVEAQPNWTFRLMVVPSRPSAEVDIDIESLPKRLQSAQELALSDPALATVELWIVLESCLRLLLKSRGEPVGPGVGPMETARSLRRLGELTDEDLLLLERGFRERSLAAHGFRLPSDVVVPSPGLFDLARELYERTGFGAIESKRFVPAAHPLAEVPKANEGTMDLLSAVDKLLTGAAPERTDELLRLWLKYGPRFVHLPDERGFTVAADRGRSILFNARTLNQIWLLGFASWRALEAYAAVLLLFGTVGVNFSEVARLPGQAKADAAFDRILGAARQLNSVHSLNDFPWPADVPEPKGQEFTVPADKASFDLICIATAYAFLHEVKHVIFFSESRTARTNPRDEEIECDKFAQDFLLEGVEKYAKDNNFPPELVRDKRAMGMALSHFVILEVTPPTVATGIWTHPASSDRLKLLVTHLDLPGVAYFWTYLASLLIAELRTERRLPATLLPGSPKDICQRLLDLI